jgi:hypothetical protein
MREILLSSVIFLASVTLFFGQEFLPPVQNWSGKSESLIVPMTHPYVTPAETNEFVYTPGYEATMKWLEMLADSSELISIKTIGVSAQRRPIKMVIASREEQMHTGKYNRANFKNILIQAGIHAGEIDGKDAGMMLLRDIAFGGKAHLLDSLNFLFIPILSVDAHENASQFNRPNQRGPMNMGWRTNARNLNLNRDYTKLETEGVRSVLYVMNTFDPVLYVDIHVTDGADYQYDITYSRPGKNTYSPSISQWLNNIFSHEVDEALWSNGHIPGPLIFNYKSEDFKKGIIKYALPIRFSDAYGDARHIPSILVENHSLKPYRQRVLGTYIFLEQTLKTVSTHQVELKKAINADRTTKPDSIPLLFTLSTNQTDSIELLVIGSESKFSKVTKSEYIHWNGQAETKKVPYLKMEKPGMVTKVPKAYYIPIEWIDVIKKLSAHGIEMEIMSEAYEKPLSFYVVDSFQMKETPVEGRSQFKSIHFSSKELTGRIPKGSVRITTDQEKGLLTVLLLDPNAPDSFFQWGYFNSVLSRTEYIEGYVMQPMIEDMLSKDGDLLERFEKKKFTDPDFEKDPSSIIRWFYSQTPYFDTNWKIVPIGIEH